MRSRLVIILLSAVSLVLGQTWGSIDYKGEPWVRNASLPYKTSRGLQNRHLSLWASHGRYFNLKDSVWKWQRPNLFTTREDLFTQTIVVPFLIPMLENAGAVVFTPRERDWQRHEVIVDNDDISRVISYIETSYRHGWQNTATLGYALHGGSYTDGENPFKAGTARYAETTRSRTKYSQVSYQPDIPEAGRYAVYVSYQTLPESVDDAHYVVWHRGQQTEFRVNQTMGGGTWVYLGTFDFDKGCNQYNRVVLTNQSGRHGVVTADAVRFGGGMGNIERCGQVSGLPRAFEGARYYAQWAGMPYEVYSSKMGLDDYGDDINSRSYMANYLSGGSCYLPGRAGLNVPIELSLAVHSDAGVEATGHEVYGTLTICTTDNNGDSLFNCGLPRTMSREFADELLSSTTRDMTATFGRWTARERYDRNYSETRNPEVPSAILETLSHQNFTDMRYGLDPNFRFHLARSVYKTMLRYICRNHDEHYVVTPLTPTNINVRITDSRRGEAMLSWTPVDDPLEPTATPEGYVVYTACGTAGFDNGEYVHGTSCRLKLEPGVLYSFRVAAVNDGGSSFPSATLSARYSPTATKTVTIIDGFQRLASPEVRDTPAEQGFDIDSDFGVSYGLTAGVAGRQLGYDRLRAGIEDSTGLGFGDDHLAGTFIAGNTFDYVRTHAQAISDSRADVNIVSSSRAAVENGLADISRADVVDLILGLERNDGYSLMPYKTFTPALMRALSRYASGGGRLMVSGAYIGRDMTASDEQAFLCEVLKCRYTGTNTYGNTVTGMGLNADIFRQPNEQHYHVPSADILEPTEGAIAAMAYADGYSAAVAFSATDRRSFTMGFPFECIRSAELRAIIMRAVLQYLTE